MSVNMDLRNITGLEEPLKILVQSLCDACSSVLKPVISRWQAKCVCEVNEMHDNMALISSMKKACEEEIVNSIHTVRDEREVRNIINVYSMAIKEMQQLLRENPSLKAVDIDPDWASEFYDHAKRCSREEMQVLWAKILVNQCRGERYFKRTLWTLRNLEPEEAECLVELAPFLIDKYFCPQFVYYKPLLLYNKIQTLLDCGCLNSRECIITIKSGEAVSIPGYRMVFEDSVKTIDFSGLSLTDVGGQLLGLIQDVKPDEQFTNEIRHHLETRFNGKAWLVEA